jgi:hypothetical protein
MNSWRWRHNQNQNEEGSWRWWQDHFLTGEKDDDENYEELKEDKDDNKDKPNFELQKDEEDKDADYIKDGQGRW